MSYKITKNNQPAKLYSDVKCDWCDLELKFSYSGAFSEKGWEYLSPDNGLVIDLIGGYGMAMDPCQSINKIVLCKECTTKLCKACPPILNVVKEYASGEFGHHCHKVDVFLFESYSGCCNIICNECLEHSGYYRNGDNYEFNCGHINTGIRVFQLTKEQKEIYDKSFDEVEE